MPMWHVECCSVSSDTFSCQTHTHTCVSFLRLVKRSLITMMIRSASPKRLNHLPSCTNSLSSKKSKAKVDRRHQDLRKLQENPKRINKQQHQQHPQKHSQHQKQQTKSPGTNIKQQKNKKTKATNKIPQENKENKQKQHKTHKKIRKLLILPLWLLGLHSFFKLAAFEVWRSKLQNTPLRRRQGSFRQRLLKAVHSVWGKKTAKTPRNTKENTTTHPKEHQQNSKKAAKNAKQHQKQHLFAGLFMSL